MDFTDTQKKYLKDVLSEQRVEFERYTGALSEDFQHKLSASLEPFIDIPIRLSRVEERLLNVEYEVKETRWLLEGVITDHSKLEKRVSVLEAKIH